MNSPRKLFAFLSVIPAGNLLLVSRAYSVPGAWGIDLPKSGLLAHRGLVTALWLQSVRGHDAADGFNEAAVNSPRKLFAFLSVIPAGNLLLVSRAYSVPGAWGIDLPMSGLLAHRGLVTALWLQSVRGHDAAHGFNEAAANSPRKSPAGMLAYSLLNSLQ